MRAFLLKILLFSLPFQLLALSFVLLDPFMVVWDYQAFPARTHVAINVDYLTTETYLENRSERGYDSFIFGSSRTLAFRTREWMQRVGSGTPFRYSATRESLFGVWGKVRLIDRRGDRIRHALLLAEPTLLEKTSNSTGHLHIKHPKVSGGSWGEFYLSFFSAYLSDFFFVKYLDYALFGEYRGYMAGAIQETPPRMDPRTNDLFLVHQDRALESDPESYYRDLRSDFRRTRASAPEMHEPVIGEAERALLEKIRAVFEEHGTCYEVVVSPNYDQAALHPKDREELRDIFGADRVHDYSGQNAITTQVRNYYEPYHFRPRVGERILRRVYAKDADRCAAREIVGSDGSFAERR